MKECNFRFLPTEPQKQEAQYLEARYGKKIALNYLEVATRPKYFVIPGCCPRCFSQNINRAGSGFVNRLYDDRELVGSITRTERGNGQGSFSKRKRSYFREF